MGETVRETQHIEPMSRRHGLALTLAGVAVMLVLTGVLYWLGGRGHLVVIFLFLAGLVMTVLGVLKLREPPYSFSLSADNLHFHHKIGGWSLHWNNIVRIDQPRLHEGLDLVELPYVGIKIRDYDEFLPLMTPRLTVHMLNDQRPLLAMALRHGAISRHRLQDWLVEDNHYRSASGRHYEGLAAMLGHRMTHMRELYGYDLLVHESNLDREPPEFVALLRRYLQPS
ncbi:hypothetical protein CGX12_09030 [Zobellella denitrificans]|uniref:DUF2982 domain-containing protein n=1 Tax=Zobellella denitrificans TaxID=347534 RepID=UPI000B8BB482|nr:DUF2982 domain-containing protein [Zobellella denitrificans]OXS15436.1 hypothetical protein CGX12_09030 [Zobellella denitrificans]